MNVIKLFVTLLSLILITPESLAAWGEEEFCKMTEVKNKKCKKGDLLYVTSPFTAIKYCDFSKPVVSFSDGDASDIDAIAICYYLGEERKRKQ
jgi:hypothetical protein